MNKISRIRLGVNIDHVATLRNARGTFYPDPLKMVKLLEKLDVDGVTVHLREDRRHIIDSDVKRITNESHLPVNLEMAATEEMQKIATELIPNAVCLVPEKREEVTTEGGLDVKSNVKYLKGFVENLKDSNIEVSACIDPVGEQINYSKEIGFNFIELHTGKYAELSGRGQYEELSLIHISEPTRPC